MPSYKTACHKMEWIPKPLAAVLGLLGWTDDSDGRYRGTSFWLTQGNCKLLLRSFEKKRSKYSCRYVVELMDSDGDVDDLFRTNSTAELIEWLWDNP